MFRTARTVEPQGIQARGRRRLAAAGVAVTVAFTVPLLTGCDNGPDYNDPAQLAQAIKAHAGAAATDVTCVRTATAGRDTCVATAPGGGKLTIGVTVDPSGTGYVVDATPSATS